MTVSHAALELELELEIVDNKKNSYYLITQIFPFVHYSVTKRIFRSVEPNTFYVTLIDDDLLNWILI